MKRTLYAVILFLAALSTAVFAKTATEVSVWVAKDVAPGPKVRLTINTRNVPVVHMAAYRLDGVWALLHRDRLTKRPDVPGSAVRQWDVTVASRDERPNPAQRDLYHNRQVNLPPLPPGVYLILATGGGKEAWAITNVTEMAVIAKRSPKQALVWICDARTGKPIARAMTALYGRDGTRLGSGVSRADGTCLFGAGPGDDQMVIVSHGGDMAGVQSGIEDPNGRLKAQFQTDRPIYRPGQTVYFKAILRRTQGRGYTPVADTDCALQVRDAKDSVLIAKTIRTNAIGTLSGEVDLPSEGTIGAYTLVINVGKESVYQTFTVAEYRKPEFKVDVKPEKTRYLAGEQITFNLQATYYFGAPVPQAEVKYQVRRGDTPYGAFDGSEGWYSSGDGNLYPRDTYSAQPFVAEGTVHTDNSGKVSIPVKTDPNAGDSSYSIQCTVQDTSRRQVEASGSVPVYASEIRLGIGTDVVFAPLGSNIPLRLSAVDLDGKPTSARVTLTIKHPAWFEKDGKYKYVEITRSRVDIPSSGRASVRLPAKAEGDLLITAETTDRTGRKAAAQFTVWVAGPEAKPEREVTEPYVEVRLDRRIYAPGDVVKAWVTTNTPDRPILLTAEGGGIFKYEVVTPHKIGFTWTVPANIEMTPNFYIATAQWAGRGLVSGNTLVPLPDLTRRLNVRVEPEKPSYRPGDKATYHIRTTDPSGKPVSSEVALSVVDEAIYALRPDATPDPYLTFWGTRENHVLTQFSAPEELSGGAYQRVSQVAPVRERFLDTAYWDAHVTTGPDGTATVTMDVPGNLTTWRATARAITGDTRVGSTTSTMQATRPVTLRLATPRQMVQGDRLILVGTVNNRTDQPHRFEVMLGAESVRIMDVTTKLVDVPAKGEGTVTWEILARDLPESGQASITGRTIATDATDANSIDLSDALKVPVLVVPNGLQHRTILAGTLMNQQTVPLTIPADHIEPASRATITIYAGLGQAARGLAQSVMLSFRYGSPGAADQLLAASAPGANPDPKVVQEAIAFLSRYQHGDGGWGWWEEGPSDPTITAHVLTSLTEAASAGITVPPNMIQSGIAGARSLYNQTNLWEYRAQLASAIVLTGHADGPKMLDEVRERGTNLSPYALLIEAQALHKLGRDNDAASTVSTVLRDAAIGPEMAYIPVGDHPGWSATTAETTAEALLVLVRLGHAPDLQAKFALWLAKPEDGAWRSTSEDALAAKALLEYAQAHPEPADLGDVTIAVNGTGIAHTPASGGVIQASVPRSLLRSGENTIGLSRTGTGQVLYSMEVRVFRPAVEETSPGMRVMRRYEVQNEAGVWQEIAGPIKPAQPVRVTILVWPDSRPDAIEVDDPIPAGFEYVDSDYTGTYARQEVRDGAVQHYFAASGDPVWFRYYLRAETDGVVAVLPASAEVIRRPAVRANTAPSTFTIGEGAPTGAVGP